MKSIFNIFIYVWEYTEMSVIWMPQQKMDCMSPFKLINCDAQNNVLYELFLDLK